MKRRRITSGDWLILEEAVQAFGQWAAEQEVHLNELKELSKEELLDLCKVLLWGRARMLEHIGDELASRGFQMHFTFHSGSREEQAAFDLQRELIQLGGQTKRNLTGGRQAATRKRSLQAKELENKLGKAINDLFQNGAGWKMSNKQVAAFLSANGFAQHFTDTTLLRKIAPMIAQVRRTESSGQ